MFDIGFPELLLVALVALLVLGPNRLPEAMRTMGLILGRLRRTYMSARAEIEREIGMDEVRRELHNESIMREFKSIESDIKKLDSEVTEAKGDVSNSIAKVDSDIKKDATLKAAEGSTLESAKPEGKQEV